MEQLEIRTPHGAARVHLRAADTLRGALVLGHGAGGGIGARDLTAASEAALERSVSVALVEQPYRVAGRRAPAPARQLDAVWTAVLARLRSVEFARLAVIVGGRSMGARVACRTAEACGACGVLCLAFPLRPPRRAAAPPPSRLDELEAVNLPVLVVQGERDPFGMPPQAARRRVVLVPGDHSLRSASAEVRHAVGPWLTSVLDEAGAQ